MQSFPMFLVMTGRRVVIAGGGEQAAQKAHLILKTEARIVLIAPELDPELRSIVASGRATHLGGAATAGSFAGAALVFIATGCPGADAALHAVAKASGTVLNVVDQPELCDALTPAIVDRDPLVVAIGTEGTAPVLARRIKTQIELILDPRLGSFAALAGRLRAAVARHVPRAERRAFWTWAFTGAPWHAHQRGAEREAASRLRSAIRARGARRGQQPGRISLVGAGPGARDLLTLRAVERLQNADIIFYDRLVDPDLLELARRDAERVFVGKAVGACLWPQERINGLIIAAARRGKQVVRLKSGDPSIFGRASEEVEAARAEGVSVEIIPGVTAASAAAASLGRSLTERGATDHVVFATGTCRPGDPDPDWGAMAGPGTTLVLYMALHRVRAVQSSLIASGWDPAVSVEVVSRASCRGETAAACALGALARTVEDGGIESPAILIARRPKPERRQAPLSSGIGQSFSPPISSCTAGRWRSFSFSP